MEKDQKKEEQKDPATNTSVVLTTQNNSTTLEKDKKKVRKYTYLNQKVNIPASYGERMQYIRNMFYDEDLPYTISRAPSNFSHNCMDLGKYFKKELQTIVEIAAIKCSTTCGLHHIVLRTLSDLGNNLTIYITAYRIVLCFYLNVVPAVFECSIPGGSRL